jgi:hypothetical protein
VQAKVYSVRVALVVVAVGVGSVAAQAARLGPADCTALKAELADMTQAGVPSQMDAPPTAIQQIPIEQRSLISRYIEIENRLLFRCPRPLPPPDPLGDMAVAIDPNKPASANDVQGQDEGKDDIILPTAVPKRQKPAGTKLAEGTAQSAAKTVAKAAAKSGDPAAPAKRSAKPKANDAFVPPATKTE